MSHLTPATKFPKGQKNETSTSFAAGPRGIARKPPMYGTAFVDHAAAEYGPIQLMPPGKGPFFPTSVHAVGQHQAHLSPSNRTGLPDHLKASIESLSGVDMSDVRVHLNSDKPASLRALAYTQGTDIHVASGEEKHISHEAWHVVQQKQGRVQPRFQLHGEQINDDQGLEHEADVMGARAAVGGPHAVPSLIFQDPLNILSPVQRTEESAKLLTELAVPKIRPGPSVKVQKELVEKLDKHDTFRAGILNLGGILIDVMPESDDDLIAQAKLVALPTSGGFISAGAPRGKEIIDQKLDRLVVENTLKTMIDADQIRYLRLAGLPSNDWRVLIEVHYYRERDMSQTGFHKDTLGETLFVNLNYHIDQAVISPEFVVNPSPSEEHDTKTLTTLPKEFRDDLAVTRQKLGNPTEYGADIANPYNYVAFVDEAIHHATPYYHHRYVTGADLEQHLAKKYPDKFEQAKKAYRHYTEQYGFWSRLGWNFAYYVDKQVISTGEIATWQELMRLVDDAEGHLTRNDLKGTLMDDEFDEVLETAGRMGRERRNGASPGFYAASIPQTTAGPVTINPGRPALKRRLSDQNFRKNLPIVPPQGQKRAFFRTWVRVVPKEKAKMLRSNPQYA